MGTNRRRREAVRKLETALETGDTAEKNYHTQQALQLLELNGELPPERERKS
ncbi:hypothetical protein [Halorussus lipolyticus]|uniref:hypothetical protein n=1 Tax=Halorussus lipolyticus TaxID=3034024 RepID=UPI0023E7A827|nr:hypothetical protein [Halorussus sp. DT80]